MEYNEIIKSAEQWKEIEGTNGKYIVSNDGKVATLRKRKKLLTLTKQKTGYLYAMIEINGKQVNKRVNRLVASAFVNNPDNLPVVNHLDGCKTNNRAENLQWVSYKSNTKHAWDKGLAKTRIPDADERKRISEKLKGRKLSEETRKKLSLAHKGKKLSKEHIEAIKRGHMRNKNNSVNL